MNNEELKKKIGGIVWKAWEEPVPCTAERKFERIADALIAAGIGDVSELKKHRVIVEQSPVHTDDNCYILPNPSPIIKQLYSGEEVEQISKERDEYKRRAEVAERALFLSAKEIEYLNGDFDSSAEFFAKEKVIPYFMKKAEKELAEEEKYD